MIAKNFKIFASLALVVSLAGCGSESTGSNSATDAPSTAAGAFPTSGSGELRLYNWTDYLDPEELDRFTEETGIEIILDTYDSNETLLAKLQSGSTGYDVIVPSDYMVQQMIELNLLQDIGVKNFPNAKNIKPEAMNVPFDDGRNFTAPYMYGTTGIICNPVAEPGCNDIKSWKDFFTLGLDKTDAMKDQVEIVSSALRATGVPAAELCTTDKAKYLAAQELLSGFKPDVIESDGSLERMLSGTSNVRQNWNGDAHRMKVENPDLVYIYPSEGLNQWTDHFAVPVGAPNVDNAKIFLNWMMDPKNIAMQTNFTGYDNSITGSSDFFDQALKDDPAVNVPAEYVDLISPIPNCGEEARELYTQVFTSLQSEQ
jgi:spermidine/putrescine transport system substrate-binding protein